ncbi:MAG TPA: hypothetical protein PKC28_16205 [Bdellovibrionales bacterium]|nr:hypothetical protein [Bdellovibrionales bacterium]
MKWLLMLAFVWAGDVTRAQSAGGGSGTDRPTYSSISYHRSSQCPKGEWLVKWEYGYPGRVGTEKFTTCEKGKVRPKGYIYNPKMRCKEDGKVRVDYRADIDGRMRMVYVTCKGGKYVEYKP